MKFPHFGNIRKCFFLQFFYRISRQVSNPRRPSIPDPDEGQLRVHAHELIEMVRSETGLSYDVAQSTIHSVLSYVSSNFSRLDRNIPALMCELVSILRSWAS